MPKKTSRYQKGDLGATSIPLKRHLDTKRDAPNINSKEKKDMVRRGVAPSVGAVWLLLARNMLEGTIPEVFAAQEIKFLDMSGQAGTTGESKMLCVGSLFRPQPPSLLI